MKLSFSKLSFSWRRWTDRLSGMARDYRSSRRGQRRAAAPRRLFLESLEDRTLLSGSPLGAGLPDLSSLQGPLVASTALVGGAGTDNATSSSRIAGPNTFAALSSNQDQTDNSDPIFTDLDPSSVVAGSNQTTLTVNGSDFMQDSVVYWEETALETNYVNATQLTAVVPANYLTVTGDFKITVVNPASGSPSNVLTFTVTEATENPKPVLNELNPSSAVAGSEQITLTVNGSNFITDSVVYWNEIALETTYVSDTQLSAVVPADYLTAAGNVAVTVVNPEPGGGTSNVLAFTITEAPPYVGPGGPENPPPAQESTLATQWNGFINFYRLLNFQYFVQMGVDPLSSLNWGAIFAQFEVNLGIARQAAPLESLILFKYFLDQGGDPYTSSIVATSFMSQGSGFTPASGSPNERAEAYYEHLGLAVDDFTGFYGLALGSGHPDDAIAAFIAAQHGTQMI